MRKAKEQTGFWFRAGALLGSAFHQNQLLADLNMCRSCNSLRTLEVQTHVLLKQFLYVLRRGVWKKAGAHVLTDYPEKRCLIRALTECSNTCSGHKPGICF